MVLVGALCSLLLLCLVEEGISKVRRYYIAAVETAWDYTHSDLLSVLQAPAGILGHGGPRPPPVGVPPRYRKAVFVEYPDGSFTQPKLKPAWMGLLGPTIRAEVYDTVVITFKNLASRPYSLHAVGVSYWKASEGAGYEDETSQPEKEGDRVDPGKTHTYVWEIQENQGPTDDDSACLTHSYSSNTNSVKDINSGLIGALLVCRPGVLWISTGTHHRSQDLPGKVYFCFKMLSSESWLHSPLSTGKSCTGTGDSISMCQALSLWHQEWGQGLDTVLTPGRFPCLLAGLILCLKKKVHWHVIGLGSGPEVHSIFFEGHTFLVRSHRLSSLEISPATYLTAQTMPGTAGWFRMFCQILSHQQGNLETYHVIQVRSFAKNKPMTWTYYIAAEEMDWDYAPVKPVSLDRNMASLYLEPGPQRIGSKYKKVMFVEYEDGTFRKRKASNLQDKGILGPVIKGEVGDQFKIVFRNLASRPYNIYPHGLTSVSSPDITVLLLGCVLPEKDVKDVPIPPGQSFTYSWSLTTEDGPTEADPRCLTRFYYSSIDPVRDTASGLIGPLLICSKKSMDQRGNQVGLSFVLVLFSVFDENHSWYLEENIKRFCSDAAHVDTQDPQFYASNVMHTINGFAFDNLQTKLCLNDVVYWYVLSVGAQTDFLSIFFSGNTFKRNMVFEDVLTLFPFSGDTVIMGLENDTAMEDFDMYGEQEHDPRSFQGEIRQYFIAAVEVMWEYGDQRPQHFLKAADPRRSRRKHSWQYRKVVFREYLDDSFTQPVQRGELDEHLGILGPYIRAEVQDVIMVTFKNLASRPFSFHSTLTAYEGTAQQGGVVQPGGHWKYSWKVLPQMAPTTQEFDCKAWAYFSNVDLEKDLHSGLIGPLIICNHGVLSYVSRRQLAVQEFSLLFTIFDETKSWYFPENVDRNCRPPCRLQQDSPDFKRNHSFHAINGYVSDTLPGLVMAQQQRVRWHLLNMGSTEDIHSVHFHGQLFNVRTGQEYRMGVYNLYPGEMQHRHCAPPSARASCLCHQEVSVGEYRGGGVDLGFPNNNGYYKRQTSLCSADQKRDRERQGCQVDFPLAM
uniref:Coagulation factor VIII n=1 Tax=Cyanoderma ruficeps TaxID=181631 RepID=A0A8C3QVJ6_9PASS